MGTTSDTLDAPPFPPLAWAAYAWEGTIILPAWAGFLSRLGPYGTPDAAATASDGTAHLRVEPPGGPDRSPPSPAQAAAYRHLLARQEAARDAVLRAVFDLYPGLQESYGYGEEEAEDLMPDIGRADELRRLIGLSRVHLLGVEKSGIAYAGFEFGCTWDDEHGLGVMTHAGRVVEVGGADTSFLEWIAERDAESSL